MVENLMNRIGLTMLLCSSVLMLAGCGGGSGSGDALLANANKTSIDRICTLYSQFQLTNQRNGPSDEATFRTYISERPAKQLERIGVDPSDIDSIFVSDRDGEKYEIIWAAVGGERDEPVAIVAEKTGVDGMRMIGFHKKPHREVDEAEYKRLFDK